MVGLGEFFEKWPKVFEILYKWFGWASPSNKTKKVLEFLSQKPHFGISWNSTSKLKILSTFLYTVWKVPKMTDKGLSTDKELIKLKFYW